MRRKILKRVLLAVLLSGFCAFAAACDTDGGISETESTEAEPKDSAITLPKDEF